MAYPSAAHQPQWPALLLTLLLTHLVLFLLVVLALVLALALLLVVVVVLLLLLLLALPHPPASSVRWTRGAPTSVHAYGPAAKGGVHTTSADAAQPGWGR